MKLNLYGFEKTIIKLSNQEIKVIYLTGLFQDLLEISTGRYDDNKLYLGDFGESSLNDEFEQYHIFSPLSQGQEGWDLMIKELHSLANVCYLDSFEEFLALDNLYKFK